MKLTIAPAVVLFLLTFAIAVPADENWPQFRGPQGNGIATDSAPPLRWGEDENVTWKVEVPGLGWSSPVIQDGRLFLTTAIPTKTDDGEQIQLALLCYSPETGEQTWKLDLFAHASDRSVQIHNKNSHASPTPIIVGDRIFVHFGPHGTACVRTDGEVLWRNESLNYQPVHGNGGSPALVDDKLIICCDGGDQQFVVALNQNTGEELWRVDRDLDVSRGFSFCTPTLIDVDGTSQVICPGSGAVMALDPNTGSEIWRVEYGQGYSVVPRPVFGNGLLYICTGYDTANLLALDPTGEGNVTETHVKWSTARNIPHSPSLLLVDDILYAVDDRGVATAFNALDGEVHWRQRLTGPFSASPTFAAGHVFFQDEKGTTTVVRSGESFEEVSVNQIADGKERTFASFAFVNNALFLRSESHLYRIEAR